MMKGADFASPKMPVRLQIEVTDRCNHDCIMCNRLDSKRALNNNISNEAFNKILDTMKPFYVTVNGLGEPLLNPEIEDILVSCRRKSITTSMPSNLSVPKVLNTKIVKHPPNIITFSIHGASKSVFELISRNSNFEKCMSALRQFLSDMDPKKVKVRILCALQAKNLGEYKKMFALLVDLGLLDSFCLIPVYDYCCNSDEDTRIIPTVSEKNSAIASIQKEITSCKDEKESAFYKNWMDAIKLIAANTPGNFPKMKLPCLIPWFSTYIIANGAVLPCCYLGEDHYTMGNISESSFSEIWNGEKYKKFRKSLRENRDKLDGCNYCSRSDLFRLQKYGFLFRGKTLWKI
jgi:radical SAM protein with 4Fe4S-binding SPASM domain